MEHTAIATNLRLLCSTDSSISATCRQIGINRQQFNKYLSGASTPSAANLRRIALHFGVRPAELLLPPEEFEIHPTVAPRLQGMVLSRPGSRGFDSAFEGQTIPLRRYLGYYLSYFPTESWNNAIICALVRIDERDGMVHCKSVERSVDPEDGTLYLSKYHGRVAMLGNRIFVMEFQSLARDALVETVLYPVGRGQQTYLRGATFGITSRHRAPFSAPIVWRFLGSNIDLRAAMRQVGLYDKGSPSLDPRVAGLLSGATPNVAPAGASFRR
ncbi:helix-turn-helix transcriptional regulator [Defluviimonas sp. D31]|uniref:helix-turn-helix domain-containing protein n=1 Tax=Defluviimonas sp. D31 TaxID=3083253 RepID=UPI00296EB552|nr:helix-turn-helix transcriptional regulator [Defluviimonas sp. D31]MDW4548229.1 helix-turn-helix transcriptional regulator [Defluviimonas sp. D31]